MSTNPSQTVDVSGLPPEAVAAVTAVVEQLRAAHTPLTTNPSPRPDETPEERVARFNEWVASHVSRNPNMDDSRDSIYD